MGPFPKAGENWALAVGAARAQDRAEAKGLGRVREGCLEEAVWARLGMERVRLSRGPDLRKGLEDGPSPGYWRTNQEGV